MDNKTINIMEKLKIEEQEMKDDCLQRREDKELSDAQERFIKTLKQLVANDDVKNLPDESTAQSGENSHASADKCVKKDSNALVRKKQVEKAVKDYIDHAGRALLNQSIIRTCEELQAEGLLVGDYEEALLILRERNFRDILEKQQGFLYDSIIGYVHKLAEK